MATRKKPATPDPRFTIKANQVFGITDPPQPNGQTPSATLSGATEPTLSEAFAVLSRHRLFAAVPVILPNGQRGTICGLSGGPNSAYVEDVVAAVRIQMPAGHWDVVRIGAENLVPAA